MSLRRYLATSTREAMAQVRRELGDDAVILSSKRVAGDRIEIVAAAPHAMESLVAETRTSRTAVMQTLAASRANAAARANASPPILAAPRAGAKPAVAAPAPLPGESFQQFVRRQSAVPAPTVNASGAPARTAASAAPALRARNPVAMYSDVATTPEVAADDDMWKPTTFHLPAELNETPVAAAPSTAARAPSRLAAPANAYAATPKHGSIAAPGQVARVDPSPYPMDAAVAAELQRQAEARQRAADRALRASFATEPAAPAGGVPRAPSNGAYNGTQGEGHAAQTSARGAMPVVDPAVFRRRPTRAIEADESALASASGEIAPTGSAPDLPAANAHDGAHDLQAVRRSEIARGSERAPTAARQAPTAPLFTASASDLNSPAAAKQTSALPTPARVSTVLHADAKTGTVVVPRATPPSRVTASATLTSALPLAARSGLSLAQSSTASTGVTTDAARASAATQRVASAPAAPLTPLATAVVVADSASNADRALMAEIQKLRAALQAQIAALSQTVAANEIQRRTPQQARVLTRLLTAGFSPQVARRVAQHTPADQAGADIDAWMHDVLALNLKCVPESDGIVERGGIFALVGPTGVGKTTTVAKLAARFAVKYGAAPLGLITLDAYRVAAHEQLRAYGRILGTPVHLAQDSGTLHELLTGMARKKLVLIDTCGLSPRDTRLAEVLDMLKLAGTPERRVAPVLLANAGSHAETIDEAARAFRANEAAGCILTKLDEATRVGGALDNALRYKLRVLGVTHGQRVPEDWRVPDSRLLAQLALTPAGQLFTLDDDEGSLLANDTVATHA